MRYLITLEGHEPFLTHWFEPDKFVSGMVVFDLKDFTFTEDGINWKKIQIDHL